METAVWRLVHVPKFALQSVNRASKTASFGRTNLTEKRQAEQTQTICLLDQNKPPKEILSGRQ